MNAHHPRLALTTLSCLLILAARSPAAEESGAAEPLAGIDSEARELLNQVVKVYQSLPAYSDRGTFAIVLKINGQEQAKSWPMSLRFARPDRIALDAGDVRLIGDGKTLTTVIEPSRKYMAEEASPDLSPARLAEGPLGAMLLGGPAGPAASHLLNAYAPLSFLVGDDPARALLDPAERLTIESDRPVEGLSCRVLRLDQAQGPDFRLLIDPNTQLVRRIELIVSADELAAKAPPGVTVSDLSVAWSSGPISTEPPQDEAFAFKVPDGFQKVEAIDVPPAREESAHELIGQAAPEFTLTLLDGPDKTRLVSKADLKGKVVLIDFWATWCGPCLLELPEIARLVESYAHGPHASDLVVIALSQDDDPADPTELRATIEETLKKQDLNLTASPIGQVGLNPSKAAGQAFQVESIPTVVLLDQDGVIRAYHIGSRPDIREVLGKEIDALLSGPAQD